MARFQCNTCLGEYDDQSPPGGKTPYYHSCPAVYRRTTVDTRRSDVYNGERRDRRNENRGADRKIKLEGLGRTAL